MGARLIQAASFTVLDVGLFDYFVGRFALLPDLSACVFALPCFFLAPALWVELAFEPDGLAASADACAAAMTINAASAAVTSAFMFGASRLEFKGGR